MRGFNLFRSSILKYEAISKLIDLPAREMITMSSFSIKRVRRRVQTLASEQTVTQETGW